MNVSDLDWARLFDKLAEQPIQIALVCTGGGSGAIARCFRRSGASKNFVEGAIPYSRAASDEYLGREFHGSRASKEFADQLAEAAYERAARLSDIRSPVATGIALVAALPTLAATDIKHQIHVALHHHDGQRCWSHEFEKSSDSRESGEEVADEMVFQAIQDAASTANER